LFEEIEGLLNKREKGKNYIKENKGFIFKLILLKLRLMVERS
jgi:hypothetical protein